MKGAILAIVLLCGSELIGPEPGQLGLGTVRIVVPPMVMFEVLDVSAPTTSSVPTSVSFDQAVLGLGQVLRISVRADGDFTLVNGPAIPATSISWTTTNIVNGIGLNGVLNKTTYTPVFQSTMGALSGRVDLSWTLAAPGPDVRAGTRQAALRWKLEAITP